MARITVEDCVDKFPSRFELVLVASQRARKLHSGEEPTVEKDNDKNTVVALREIADSTISINQMKENLIEEYQTITINDEENENLEIESSKENQESSSENSEQSFLDNSETIDEEIKELSSAQESELAEQYEISEDLDKVEETSTSENLDKESE